MLIFRLLAFIPLERVTNIIDLTQIDLIHLVFGSTTHRNLSPWFTYLNLFWFTYRSHELTTCKTGTIRLLCEGALTSSTKMNNNNFSLIGCIIVSIIELKMRIRTSLIITKLQDSISSSSKIRTYVNKGLIMWHYMWLLKTMILT
jgi:hypothetical protein